MDAKRGHCQIRLIVFLLVLSRDGLSQSIGPVTVGKEDTIYSQILHETRPFLISLPASYGKDDFYAQKHYPVLVLLDADTHFRYAASMIEYLSGSENEQIPELIVVGVRNTNRTRDMTPDLTGKPNPFAEFLEQELLPHIDQHYRTAPYRLLAGHSLAGLFTLTSLLDQRLFKAYIAIDPTLTWKNGYLPQKADSLFRKKTFNPARVFLSQANNPFEPGQHTGARGKAFDAFRVSLANNGSKSLSDRYAFYKGETHFSVPFRSLYDGLLFIFEGYSLPFQTLLAQGSAGISRHYQRLFTQLGVDLLPPGKVINQAGLFLLQSQHQVNKALDLLQLNEGYYPNAPEVHRSLARVYQTKGDKNRAIQYYRNVLALAATDEQATKAIKELINP